MEILYEDNHLLAINKPAGWLVQGDHTGDQTLTDWGKAYLKEKYNKPGAVFLHPVHRIDRPVSGIVLFARTDKALTRLMETFRTREVRKSYCAWVLHTPEPAQATLTHWLSKNESKNYVTAYPKPHGDAKESILEYKVKDSQGGITLLHIFPLTGRSHQIRTQLAFIGCPIVGDLKYGALSPLPDASIALHAMRLELMHPVKKEMILIEAATPGISPWI